MTLRLPHLVIAGAPKCGTGSLFAWLSAHPGVCPSRVKETYYLMDRDSPLFAPEANIHEHGFAGYSALFAHCELDCVVRMEATPDYLYQQGAPHFLAGMEQPPLVVVSLRKPSERVYSAWRFFRGNLAVLPGDLDFSGYVRRLHARESFPGKLGPLAAAALEHSRYEGHCRRWVQALGRQRLRFVLFEDLVRDPGRILQSLCQDLGLDPSFYAGFEFPAHNVSIRVRCQALHRWRNRLAGLLPPGGYRRFTSLAYRFLNHVSRPPERSGQDLRTLRELDAYFAPDVERLAESLDLDLSAWGEQGAGPAGEAGQG